MTLKLNVSNKGKAWKVEVETSTLAGKSVGDKINGKDIKPELGDYELEITGGSDFAGFPLLKTAEGIGLKRVLLTKGWGLHKKPKGLKKKQPRFNKGLRLRKTVRGKTIAETTIQVNLNVIKEGKKPLAELFPDQNKPKQEAPKETPKEEKAVEAPAQ